MHELIPESWNFTRLRLSWLGNIFPILQNLRFVFSFPFLSPEWNNKFTKTFCEAQGQSWPVGLWRIFPAFRETGRERLCCRFLFLRRERLLELDSFTLLLAKITHWTREIIQVKL